jgi:diguanylate cyclase (GGDEF)-like protein
VCSLKFSHVPTWAGRRADRSGAASNVRRWVLGDLSYLLAAVAILVLLPTHRTLPVAGAVAAVGAFVVARFVIVRLPVGVASGIQPAFVLVLFAVPLNLVPIVVLLATLTRHIAQRCRPSELLFSFGDNWFCVGPTLVLALWAPGHASWSHWPVYVAAFAAQFLSDTAIGAGRRVLEFGRALPDRETVLLPVVVDALLTPVGLVAAISAPRAPVAALAVVLGVVGVLGLLARERGDRLEQEQRALHDPLTGLANRALFEALLEATARRCARSNTSGGVLVLDLTRFKDINDSYGHACGDRVLSEFGARVRSCVRDADTVARIGGDEFAVLLDEPTTLAGAHAAAGKLRSALFAPIEIAGVGQLLVEASVGAAAFDADVTPGQALAEADTAMYVEKRAKPVFAGRAGERAPA